MDHLPFTQLPAVQADALAAVVELEALWENIPAAAAGASPGEALRGLTAKQRAFDAYRAGLIEYNRRYGAAYHGERPATTSKRLGAWCRRLAALYLRANQTGCPVQVLEKAHRAADRLATRLGTAPCSRPAAPASAADAVADLQEVAGWCDGLAAGRISA
jgi:hypothetical protein